MKNQMSERVLVIGAGAMGGWFAAYFKKKRKYNVIVFDKDQAKASKLARSLRISHVKRLDGETLRNADLILVSTPIEATPNILENIARRVEGKGGVTVVEVTSVKSEVVKVAKRIVRKKRITVVSVHPLFGPGVASLRGQSIIVTPVADGRKEVGIAEKLFPEAKLYVMNHREHDRTIAYTLSLMRLILITILKNWKPFMEKPKTTSQKLLLLTASTLINESPSLFTQIIKKNPYSREAAEQFIRDFNNVRSLDVKRLRRLYNRIRRDYEHVTRSYAGASKIAESLVIE